jgi:hypothetical protein
MILVCRDGEWNGKRSVQCCEDYDCPYGYDCENNRCVLENRCGDGLCRDGENRYNCPQDCGPIAYCGDGICNYGETQYSCPQDCGNPEYCGDNVCNNGETCSSCQQDCGACSYCGDGTCDLNTESQQNCPQDCGHPAVHSVAISVADECHEINQSSSGIYSLSIVNNGNVPETLALSASGIPGPWTVQQPSITVFAGQSESWEVTVSVPDGTEPGLYNLTISADNSNAHASTLLLVDVKLSDMENLTQATQEGNEDEQSPTGAFIAGDIRIPEWALIVVVIAIIVVAVIILFSASSAQGAAKAPKKAVLTTDGGY